MNCKKKTLSELYMKYPLKGFLQIFYLLLNSFIMVLTKNKLSRSMCKNLLISQK